MTGASPEGRAPLVAVVGRPNVGKSTLVNRIFGARTAIVEERPGVTRDRKEVGAEWCGRTFRLVDTGGWSPAGDELDAKVSRQSEKAISQADVCLLVVDAVTGVVDEDVAVARTVRRHANGRVLVVVNKVDAPGRDSLVFDALSLGLGEPIGVSALHGRGAGDLLDALVAALPDPLPESGFEHLQVGSVPVQGVDSAGSGGGDETPAPLEPGPHDTADRIFAVALVGRPNVGKSTLFNRLIGEERSVVHDVAGTTRDTVDTVVDTPDGPLRFVDTAGMRRRARIDAPTEYFSLVRALEAVDAADVALLVIDATVGVTAQDQRLAERIDVSGSPVVVVLNKWELIDDAQRRTELGWQVRDKLRFLGEAPVVKVSALTGKGVHRLAPTLAGALERYRRRVPTSRVNTVLRAAQSAQPGPHGARVLYGAQVASDPPTFTLFANRELPVSYLRYLERRLREDLELGVTPIKVRVRRRSG